MTDLDIVGAFDTVWLIAKLEQLGITGDQLHLFSSCLTGRSLCVVVNGHTSTSFPIEASVPQGLVLQSVPLANAYADDCTLS